MKWHMFLQKIWWLSIDDTNKNLQNLALIMINIIPHSASCERIFSTLGWIYGKKRLRLSVQKVEGMAKVRSYYMSTITDELKYTGKNFNSEELKSMVEEALDDEDGEDDYNDDNGNDNDNDVSLENEERLEIPDHGVFVVIENIFYLEKVPYILDSNDIDDESSSSDNDDSYVNYNYDQANCENNTEDYLDNFLL